MEHSGQIVVSDSIVHEFPDIYANTMAVDSTGRFAILCSRKCMIIVELDNVIPTSKKVARNSKWDPGSSQFNRLIKDLFALTTYQMVDIYSIEDNLASAPKLTLRGHTRAITDIDWSHFDPYLLATSSADCNTNLWDIRDNRRPLSTLTSVSGATQVKFCKTSSNLVATSHEIDVRIWDTRQPNLPLHYVAAHLQKINGLDWNPHIGDQMVTCSQDCTIRLWDLSVNKIKPGLSASSKSSAWRIRYTPFSSVGVVTSILPQLSSRSECNSLNLWSIRSYRYEKRFELLSTLVGHTDIVIDFDWRVKGPSGETGDHECELVSWSKDQTLRIWQLDHQLTELQTDISDTETEGEIDNCCADDEVTLIVGKSQNHSGQDLDPTGTTELMKNLMLGQPSNTDMMSTSTSIGVPGRSFIDVKESQQEHLMFEASINLASPKELQQEFSLINKNIPNVVFEELNPLRRLCLINARANNVSCRLRIALPPAYPHNESPTFTIIDATHPGSENLTNDAREKLLAVLNETAHLQLSRNRNCLEPCIRKFISTLQRLTVHRMRRKGSLADSGTREDAITISMQRDHSVPFPRTSGARFSGDLLICFGRPILQTNQPAAHTSKNGQSGASRPSWLVETPRTMAQLSAFLDNRRKQTNYTYMLSNISISHFYYGASRHLDQAAAQGKQHHQKQQTTPSSQRQARGRLTRASMQSQAIIAKSLKCGPVLVCDVSAIQMGAINRYLAENYVFDHDVIRMCRKNAEVSRSCGRKDLVQVWQVSFFI
ncbi:GATOR complex protein WDR59, partial [Fragariocoptes setiger]